MDKRIESLIKSLERNYKRWNETFDEDTGEAFTIERHEIISFDTTEEERNLMENIANDLENITNEDLLKFREIVNTFGHRHFDELYIELVNRGEQWASQIDNPAVLQNYSDRGNEYATYALYEKYMYGDEKNGIFINRKKAREYYDMVGDIPFKEEWDDDYSQSDDIPNTFQYSLNGNDETINEVEKMINDLCQSFGTPDNEFGLYVPLQMLIKELVDCDSKYYRGNVLTMERKSSNNLIITTESNTSEPLLYALRYRYKNLNIEMSNIEE